MVETASPEFTGLVDKEFDFYGVDGNCFKLGDAVFEAVEDESDGYRSYLGNIEVKEPGNLIFFKTPLGRVRIEPVSDGESSDHFGGWKFVDTATAHCWLEVGTNYSDDYYPSFVFHYKPVEPVG